MMLNPLMLFGLLGLGLPILIHLINRRRLPPEILATMRFVEGRDVANVFAVRPRDVPQLLLRLLLLLLFVLLMARLTRPAERASDRATVIVLDNSLSMQRRTPAGPSLFEAVRRQAQSVIDAMRESDVAAVIVVGDRVFTDTGLIRDRALLREAVESAWASDGGARALLPAIRQAVAELQGEAAPDRAVVVFSDLRRETLAGAEPESMLQQQLAAGGVRLVLIGEPLPESDNVAVERAAFHPAAVHIGGGSKLTARIRNHGEREQVVELGLSVAAGEGESRPVTLAPGAAAHVDLVHRFDLPTDVAAAADVRGADALPADDRFLTPMRMRQRRHILLVTSPAYQVPEGLDRGYSGVDVLRYAMNPDEALGLPSGVHTAVRRITPAAFARATLSMYAAVVFYGVDALPEETSIRDLRDYVGNGGGLWLIPDQAVTPTVFNTTYGELMAGLRIGVVREPAVAVFAGRNEAALDAPLLAPLLRGEWGSLDEIPVARYRSVQQTGTARGALVTRDGDWLAAVASVGRGRVFLQLFDCGMQSTAFPRSPAFLPLVQTVLTYLTGGDRVPAPDVMRAGDTHYLQFPAYRELGGDVVLEGPAAYRFPVAADGWVRVSDVFVAGQYEITHADLPGRRARILSVNPVAGESDLTQADAAELDRVFGSVRVDRIPFDALGDGYTYRREISAWLLALVLAALSLEALAGAWGARRREVARA